MRTLASFFGCPFDDDEFSISEINAFTSDHLERMIANNPGGILTARIGITTTLYGNLEDTYADDVSQLGERKGTKAAKRLFRKEELIRSVNRIVGVILANYDKGSPEMITCLPHGQSVFSSAPDDDLIAHLTSLKNGVVKYQATLGAATVTQATDLLAAWEAIHTASEGARKAKARATSLAS